MKALLFDGRVPAWGEVPDPAALPGHAVIRPVVLGIGDADLALAAGRLRHRGVMGHEFVGVVEAVGSASDRAWIGKRVVGDPAVACAACDLCARGGSHLCPRRAVLGLHNLPGCFAERFVLPVGNLAEVPRGVPDEAAVLSGLVGAAIHAARVTRPDGKNYVTVLGDSPAALVAAQVLARRNATVRLLGESPDRLNLCEKWGVKHRHAADAGRRCDQTIVYDFTGDAKSLALALDMVQPRGKIVLASWQSLVPRDALVPAPAAPADLSAIMCHEIELVGAGATGVREGLSAIARGEVETSSLTHRRMRLGDAPEALAAAAHPGSLRVSLAA